MTATPKELAHAGVFGAAAMLLPVLFHVLQLGKIFMPMYLPLVALAFFVRLPTAATTALVVPLLSGLLTGMPPFHPPIAVMMGLELALMAATISAAVHRLPNLNPYAVLMPALLLGRVAYVSMVYGAAQLMELPPTLLATVSLLSGWPGILLMLAAIPPLVMLHRHRIRGALPRKEMGA